MTFRRFGFTGLLTALVFLFACTDDSTGPGKSNPPPAEDTTDVDTNVVVDTLPHAFSIEISGTTSLEAGTATHLVLTVRDSAGEILPDVPVTWKSSDSARLAVEAGGIVRAHRIATVRITATVVAAGGILTDTVTFTSFLPPYTFTFADTVPESERRLILDAVQDADNFHKLALGRPVQGMTTVSGVYSAPGCASGGAAAYTGAGTVVFCLGNPGWKNNGPVRKQKIVQHEVFHVWQFESGWISNPSTAGATWLIEGTAEWMGYRGVAEQGLVSFDMALGCQVKEAADFATRTPPGLPALSSVEARAAFQSTAGPLYTHSMLAAHSLFGVWTSGTSQVPSFVAYADSIKAGVAWQASFQSAFGKSTATFYSQFPGYVAGLMVPANYLCGI